MEQSRWLPVRFKGNEIYAQVDAAGEFVVKGGKVAIVYKLGAPKSYSTFADRLERIPGKAPVAGAAAPPKAGSKTKTKKAKANDDVFGGTRAEVGDAALIHVWTDGACSGNPGPAGSGTVIVDGGRKTEMSRWLGNETNNVAELVAIEVGLAAIPDDGRTVVVHSDSQYCIGVLARGWKAKANHELIGRIRKQVDARPKVVWHWVRGHEGVELNERCDELARQAIARRADWDGSGDA
jgi:ribonuclease HI